MREREKELDYEPAAFKTPGDISSARISNSLIIQHARTHNFTSNYFSEKFPALILIYSDFQSRAFVVSGVHFFAHRFSPSLLGIFSNLEEHDFSTIYLLHTIR